LFNRTCSLFVPSRFTLVWIVSSARMFCKNLLTPLFLLFYFNFQATRSTYGPVGHRTFSSTRSTAHVQVNLKRAKLSPASACNEVSPRIRERNFIITLEICRDYCRRLAVTAREWIPSARPGSDSACKPPGLTLAEA